MCWWYCCWRRDCSWYGIGWPEPMWWLLFMATTARGAGAVSSRRQRWRLAQGGRSEREEDVEWRFDRGQHGWTACGLRARWEEGAAGGGARSVLRRRCSDESLAGRLSVCLPLRARLSAVPRAVTAGSACAGGDEVVFRRRREAGEGVERCCWCGRCVDSDRSRARW